MTQRIDKDLAHRVERTIPSIRFELDEPDRAGEIYWIDFYYQTVWVTAAWWPKKQLIAVWSPDTESVLFDFNPDFKYSHDLDGQTEAFEKIVELIKKG